MSFDANPVITCLDSDRPWPKRLTKVEEPYEAPIAASERR